MSVNPPTAPVPEAPSLRVIRGGVHRLRVTAPSSAPLNSTHRYFVDAVRDAFLGMTTQLRRMPAPAWYELSRAKKRRQAWGSNLLAHLGEAVDAGVSREELMKVPELITAFIDAKLAELPQTGMSDALEDYTRRSA